VPCLRFARKVGGEILIPPELPRIFIQNWQIMFGGRRKLERKSRFGKVFVRFCTSHHVHDLNNVFSKKFHLIPFSVLSIH